MTKQKKRCAECGRSVYVGKGIFTQWRDGERLDQPTFFCLTCIRKIEKKRLDQRNAEVLAVRKSWMQEALQQPPLQERMNAALIVVLRQLCPVAGWYSLRQIAERNPEHFPRDSRAISHGLNRLGFTKRARKKRGSYMHVFIDPTKLPNNALQPEPNS